MLTYREPTERNRLDTLASYQILDTLPEAPYDALTRLAAHTCQTPISMISLLDEHRQWVKSAHGVSLNETARLDSFCRFALEEPDRLLVVPDARRDDRFVRNPFVVGEPGVAFYAGAPLVTSDGVCLGTLCVMDFQPRELTLLQQEMLGDLAAQVVSLLELRRANCLLLQSQKHLQEANQKLKDEHQLLQAVVDNTHAGLIVWEALRDKQGTIFDFRYVLANSVIATLTGYPLATLATASSLKALFPVILENGFFNRLVDVVENARAQHVTEFHPINERGVWEDFTLIPLGERVLFTMLDITSLKELEQRLMTSNQALESRVAERTAEVERLSAFQKAVLAHASTGIMATDDQGIIRLVNPALEKLLGYSADELVGKLTPAHLRDPDYMDAFQRQLAAIPELAGFSGDALIHQYIRRQGTVQREGILLHKAGHRIPVLSTFSALYDEEGTLTGYVNIVADISELKQAQDELQVSSQRLRLATQATGQGVWEYNLRSKELLWDERMHQIHGTHPDTFGGMKHLQQLVHFDDRESLTERSNSHDQFQGVYRILQPGGTNRYAEYLGIVVRDEAGLPLKAIGVACDITERREAELALQQSEQKFREFADAVDNIFWIHSATTFELLYINATFERMTGLSAADLAQDPFSYFSVVREEHRAPLAEATKAYFAGQTIELEFSFQLPQGEPRWIHLRTFTSRNASGEAIRYMGIARDITHQKATEMALRSALEKEKQLNTLKSGFVTTVSHEFRTPLATIQSSLDLIQLYLEPLRPQLNKAVGRHMGIIEGEIKKFSALLMDVLTLGRIEAGRVMLVRENTALPDWCAGVVATHFQHRSDGRQVRLEVRGEARPILLDTKLLEHVLVNLLSNAFKFSQGEPKLILTFGPEDVTLAVADDGIGIPADELPHLFQRFYRASNVGTIQGTGLGLVITREFVELHGGKLEVDSVLHRGTTFTIRLTAD